MPWLAGGVTRIPTHGEGAEETPGRKKVVWGKGGHKDTLRKKVQKRRQEGQGGPGLLGVSQGPPPTQGRYRRDPRKGQGGGCHRDRPEGKVGKRPKKEQGAWPAGRREGGTQGHPLKEPPPPICVSPTGLRPPVEFGAGRARKNINK